jgi:hypothetical protein
MARAHGHVLWAMSKTLPARFYAHCVDGCCGAGHLAHLHTSGGSLPDTFVDQALQSGRGLESVCKLLSHGQRSGEMFARIVMVDPMCIEYASPAFVVTRELALRCVRVRDGELLRHMGEMRDDTEVCAEAVATNPGSVMWAMPSAGTMQADEAWCLVGGLASAAVSVDPTSFLYLDVRFHRRRDLVLLALRTSSSLHRPCKIWGAARLTHSHMVWVALSLIQTNPRRVRNMPPAMREEHCVCAAAVAADPSLADVCPENALVDAGSWCELYVSALARMPAMRSRLRAHRVLLCGSLRPWEGAAATMGVRGLATALAACDAL